MAQIACYYFPSWHRDSRYDLWHGQGWTEWELVKAARPRFEGHRQPIVPAWGYFDEADPAWSAREIDLAADHAIDAFIYDWYWYDDGSFLIDALERGFLQAPNRRRMKFALMWANHDWMNIHPAPFVNHPQALTRGAVNRQTFDTIVDYVIEKYFSQNNYWRIDGRPYFSIYDLPAFLRGLGGLDGAARALDHFRDRTRHSGAGELHLNVQVFGLQVLPSETKLANVSQVVQALGCDSAGTYAWVHHYSPDGPDFPHRSYAQATEAIAQAWEHNHATLGLPYHASVCMGWDCTPRTIQTDRYEKRGYPWTGVFEGNTPQAFGQALRLARAFCDRPDVKQKVVTLNAWNEWTEGSYLLPDTVYGNAYLEQIREVFGR